MKFKIDHIILHEDSLFWIVDYS